MKRSHVAAAAVAAAKAKTKAHRPSTRAEGKRELKSAKQAAKPLTGGDGCKVEIGIDEGFAMTFAGDPYSVAVHGLGHMLGNPDGFFRCGAETLDMEIRQLVDSGDPERVKEAANLSGRSNMPLLSGKRPGAGTGAHHRPDDQPDRMGHPVGLPPR